MKIMVPVNPHRVPTVIHHGTAAYRAEKNGEWQIEDGHAEALRSHGLVTKDEAQRVAKAKLADERGDELEMVRAQLSEMTNAVTTLRAENASLKRSLADAQDANTGLRSQLTNGSGDQLAAESASLKEANSQLQAEAVSLREQLAAAQAGSGKGKAKADPAQDAAKSTDQSN